MAIPLELLRKIDLFEEMSKKELDRLAKSFRESRFSAGETIAAEGTRGVGFFVIGEGATASAARKSARPAPATTSARSL